MRFSSAASVWLGGFLSRQAALAGRCIAGKDQEPFQVRFEFSPVTGFDGII